MGISLHEATVPQYLQMLHTVLALIDKAEAHCAEKGINPSEVIGCSLAEDMAPFAYQIHAATVHSAGAIRALREGLCGPDFTPPADSFDAMRTSVKGAIAELEALDPAELDALQDKDMRFEYGDFKLPFVGHKFLLSYAQPNFYFHVTTAYALLRSRGVQIGKADFLGPLQLRM